MIIAPPRPQSVETCLVSHSRLTPIRLAPSSTGDLLSPLPRHEAPPQGCVAEKVNMFEQSNKGLVTPPARFGAFNERDENQYPPDCCNVLHAVEAFPDRGQRKTRTSVTSVS